MSGPGAGRAMVLTYHSISPGAGPLRVSPRRLEQQLDGLERAGWRGLALSEVVSSLEGGRPFAARGFALTFDDGYRDFADAALPILERRALPATLFVTTSPERGRLPGGLPGPLLPLEALPELAARGVEIGGHSVGHADLTRLEASALEREIEACAGALEERVGRKALHFAYPFGCANAAVRAAVARRFHSACTTRLARVVAGGDPFAIPRVDAFYLRSPILRFLLGRGAPEPYLRVRRALRRLRGSEPPGLISRRSGLPRCGTLPGVPREVAACR